MKTHTAIRISIHFALFLIVGNHLHGQTLYKQLLDASIKGAFVVSKIPLKIDLHEIDLKSYRNYLASTSDSDTLPGDPILLQLIRHSHCSDTTEWSDDELDKFILIKNNQSSISLEYIKRKFSPSRRQLRVYRKLIDEFNQCKPKEKAIYAYSRPVFDDSRNYAIIKWHVPKLGEGITLYYKKPHGWDEGGSLIVTRL